MPHPADRHLRRLTDARHREKLTGTRHEQRAQARQLDRRLQLDVAAILAEYDYSLRIDIPGWLAVFAAENILAD